MLTTPLAVDDREAQHLFGELVLRSDATEFEAAENTPGRERKTSVMFGHPNAWDTAGVRSILIPRQGQTPLNPPKWDFLPIIDISAVSALHALQ